MARLDPPDLWQSNVALIQSVTHPVKAEYLESLYLSLKRWDQFLGRIFLGLSTRSLNSENLDTIAIEDTERCLDVKIQLSQCFSSIHDSALESEFEEILREIRKITYHYINTTLLNMGENSRGLIEMVQKKDELSQDTCAMPLTLKSDTYLATSTEYKDCLVSQRKHLKLEASSQHKTIIVLFSRLKRLIGQSFSEMAAD